MIGKKLARMIKRMTDQELYAFVTASVLELERRSSETGNPCKIEDIINSVYTVSRMLKREDK